MLASVSNSLYHCEGHCSSVSKTTWTARHRTFEGFLILAPFSIAGASSRTGAVQPTYPHRASVSPCNRKTRSVSCGVQRLDHGSCLG